MTLSIEWLMQELIDSFIQSCFLIDQSVISQRLDIGENMGELISNKKQHNILFTSLYINGVPQRSPALDGFSTFLKIRGGWFQGGETTRSAG